MSISPNGTVHRGASARTGRVFTVINSAGHGAGITRLIFYGAGQAWDWMLHPDPATIMYRLFFKFIFIYTNNSTLNFQKKPNNIYSHILMQLGFIIYRTQFFIIFVILSLSAFCVHSRVFDGFNFKFFFLMYLDF